MSAFLVKLLKSHDWLVPTAFVALKSSTCKVKDYRPSKWNSF